MPRSIISSSSISTRKMTSLGNSSILAAATSKEKKKSKGNGDSFDDHCSPYFLSPSDNPGVQLVKTQLNGSNYNNWHRSMITALTAKNKLDFATGKLSRPFSDDEKYAQWQRCNSMVISWIRNSVVAEISSSIMYLEDAALIWEDLKDRFSQGDLARIYQLKQELMNLKQGEDSVGTYYTKLRVIWDEYRDFLPNSWCLCDDCSCGSSKKWCNYLSQECAMQFLIGLNSTYSQIRSNFISSAPLPSMQKIFSLVMQKERQRTIESASPSPILSPPSFGDSSGSIINATAGGRGRGGRGKFLCTKCGKTSHTVDRCFEIIGFPPGYGRGRGKPNGVGNRSVNQMSAEDIVGEVSGNNGSIGGISAANMAQMFSYFQNQMQLSAPTSNAQSSEKVEVSAATTSAASPPFSGSFSGHCDWEG